jgi:ATP-dependent Clp protease ATP-binding subunit ClpA
MFERFTQRARRVVVLAQEEARLANHNYIGTEHLLLGLIHEQDGVASRALAAAGVTLDAARAQVESMIGPGQQEPSGHIPFTPRAKKILELSLREALEQKQSYIGTEHILLGLLREGDGAGAQVLVRLAGPLSALREQTLELAAAEPEEEPAAEELAAWSAMGRRGTRQLAFARSAEAPVRVGPGTIADFRAMLASIDRRLANIERHLGIAVEAEPSAEAEPAAEAESAAEQAE